MESKPEPVIAKISQETLAEKLSAFKDREHCRSVARSL
jgi:hypothetical protein